MNTEAAYANVGEILRTALKKNGNEFLAQTDALEEYLKKEKCEPAIVHQLILFLQTGNLTRYIPQTHTNLSMIDINNILSCTEEASGLSRDTVKKLMVMILYALSLPTALTTVEYPTLTGKAVKDAVLEPTDGYAGVLSEIRSAVNLFNFEKLKPLLPKLNRMAENGNAEALYLKGRCYYFGLGTEQNEAEAVRYYEMAAHNGCIKAYADLGDYYFEEARIPDFTKAFAYYTMLGAVADSEERRENLKIIVEEKRLNRKLLAANAILLAVLVIFDLLVRKGAFSAYGTTHPFGGIIAIFFAVAGFALSVFSYIKWRYNSLTWTAPLIFVLDMFSVFFALL